MFRAEWGVITVNNDSLKALLALALLERRWWHLQQRGQSGAAGGGGGSRKTRIQLPPALRALCGRAAAFSPGSGGGSGRFLSSRSYDGKELRDYFFFQVMEEKEEEEGDLIHFISAGGHKWHPGTGSRRVILWTTALAVTSDLVCPQELHCKNKKNYTLTCSLLLLWPLPLLNCYQTSNNQPTFSWPTLHRKPT